MYEYTCNMKFAKKLALITVTNLRKSSCKCPKVPFIKLNDGHRIPALGLGTWLSPPGEVTSAVKIAIDVGYRHIDGAHVYENEPEVGEAINCKIDEGVVKRDELFITSKIWNTFHNPDLVRSACETTLKNLNTPYINLYLIHWPMGWKEGDELFPTDKEGNFLHTDYDYVDTWKEMEKLVDYGLTKSIGISNFNSKQIQRILKKARIPPAVNQVECHPYLNQSKLMKFCKTKNIVITGYSPLGAPERPMAKPDDPVLMDDARIIKIAKKYKKTPAHILIRYQLQRGNVVIPKALIKCQIAANFDVFGFELCDEHMEEIDCMDCNKRLVDFPMDSHHPHYPFKEKFY